MFDSGVETMGGKFDADHSQGIPGLKRLQVGCSDDFHLAPRTFSFPTRVQPTSKLPAKEGNYYLPIPVLPTGL